MLDAGKPGRVFESTNHDTGGSATMCKRGIGLLGALALGLGTVFAQYGDISDVKVLKPQDRENVKSELPPAGAIVLFDGTEQSLEKWVKKDNKTPTGFHLVEGRAMQVKGGDSITREKFDGKFKLHVEFRVPYEPGQKGQGRGNSGVYLQGRYEVQVLDSYGLQSGKNDCGAIYEIAAPSVNACKAPTIWQSYDIGFNSPKCQDGKRTEWARMTVLHNGIKIHDNVEVTSDNTRSGMGGDPCTPGPILLQDHGHPVQYRNIWLLPEKN